MKKLFVCFLLLNLLGLIIGKAQAPQSFTYQGVATTTQNKPIASKNIKLRFSILTGTTTSYRETQSVLTAVDGYFTAVIGTGTKETGDFTTVNWAGSATSLKVEMDTLNGTNYTIIGTTAIQGVPFALQAVSAIQIQNRSISTTAPINGQVLKYNTTTSSWEPGTDLTSSGTAYTGGTGINVTGTTITNTSPDQTVTITTPANSGLSITGTYPNFVVTSAFKAPTVKRITSGSGIYTPPTGCKYLEIAMVGAGGSGGLAGTYGVTSGSSGGNTLFGDSLLIAGGGTGGGNSYPPGIGGLNKIKSSVTVIVNVQGGSAGTGTTEDRLQTSGTGGNTFFGGGGSGGTYCYYEGTNGAPNTGGGGGGRACDSNPAGTGGGGGGYLNAYIYSPFASAYYYSVGVGGVGGGGSGGSGVIIIKEFYQ